MIKNLPSKNSSNRNKHRRLPLQHLSDLQFQQLIADDLMQPRAEAVEALLNKAAALMRSAEK